MNKSLLANNELLDTFSHGYHVQDYHLALCKLRYIGGGTNICIPRGRGLGRDIYISTELQLHVRNYCSPLTVHQARIDTDQDVMNVSQ